VPGVDPGAALNLASALRPFEYLVPADPPPDDVRLRAAYGRTEGERGAAVWRESKLVHPVMAGERVHERVAR